MQSLLSIYDQTGQFEKAQEVHMRMANLQTDHSSQEYNKEIYLAAVCALKSGNFDDAKKILQDVIANMESRKETRDQDFGCVVTEPRYTVCVQQLGNSILDGSANYDSALPVYDKGIKAASPEANGTDSDGPAGGARDNRVERRPASYPGGGPRPSGPPTLSTEQLANMLICCDAIGNAARADSYRTLLKAQVQRVVEAQERAKANTNTASAEVPGGKTNPYLPQVLILVDKTKRSRNEEVQMMELLPQVLNHSSVYSGNPDGVELLERAVAIKTHAAATANPSGLSLENLKDDYAALVHIYLIHRRFDQAQALAVRRLEFLHRTRSSEADIALANIDYANTMQERGMYSLAAKTYLQALPTILNSAKDRALFALKNAAYCYQMCEDYPAAIKFLKQAIVLQNSLPNKNAEQNNDLLVRLGVLYDLTGQRELALAQYKAINQAATKDSYVIYEPLRNAADYQAQLKHFELADALYRRQVELQGNLPSDALGKSNSWSQMARMYKGAKRYDKAKAAYEAAIAALKTNPNDSFCQSQIKTMQQEMQDMAGKSN